MLFPYNVLLVFHYFMNIPRQNDLFLGLQAILFTKDDKERQKINAAISGSSPGMNVPPELILHFMDIIPILCAHA